MTNPNINQKIVVAVDGSVTAQNAVEVAIQIARAESQLVEGFYVVDEPLILDPYADYVKELGSDRGMASRVDLLECFKELGLSVLDQLRDQCASLGVPVITEVLTGGIPEIILDQARQASFLALGRRGNRHASVSDHLGENFRQIAHYADVPVIVGGDTVTPIKRLFLIYDGSEKANLAFKLALRFEQTLAAKVTIGLTGHMYLEDNPNDLLFRLSEGGIAKNDLVDLRSKPVYKVVETITERQADLIIMAGYRHPEIIEWLVGSPNDQILRQSSLPAVIA
jgi:nucleotide-binding universal stress UspA family protein